jgi:hypothetical protein
MKFEQTSAVFLSAVARISLVRAKEARLIAPSSP